MNFLQVAKGQKTCKDLRTEDDKGHDDSQQSAYRERVLCQNGADSECGATHIKGRLNTRLYGALPLPLAFALPILFRLL